MAIFGKRKHAVLRYSAINKNIEFLCKDDGDIQWFGALFEVYEFMAAKQTKRNKYVYAVNDQQYMELKLILQQAAEGIRMVSGPDDRLFDARHMTQVAFKDYTSCVAFPSFNYYKRKLQNNPGDNKLRNFIQSVANETSECKSCGQDIVSPTAQQLSEKMSNTPELQRLVSVISNSGAYCVPCATLLLCEVAAYRIKNYNDVPESTMAIIDEARSIVLDEDKDMTKAVPLLMDLATALGGVGVSKVKVDTIQPWLK